MASPTPPLPVSKKRPYGKTVVLIPFEYTGNLLLSGSEGNVEYWKFGKDAVVNLKSGDLHHRLGSLVEKDDVLYVVGHSAAGFDGLANAEKVTEAKDKIDSDGLIEILKKFLNKNFAGKIKIFACEAALPTVNRPAFVSLVAKKVGGVFPHCHVFGYEQKLRMGFYGRSFGDCKHKWTSTTPLKRASSARVEFDVTTGQKKITT